MKITEQEKKERKERIVQTAFSLFCQKGIEHVTLVDISRASRVGETTIYRYFGNKVQLVLSTLSVLWHEIGVKLNESMRIDPDYSRLCGYEQLRRLLEGCKTLYLDNAEYILFSYEAKLYLQRNKVQISAENYDSLMAEIKELCMAALEKGKKDGSIPVEIDSEDLFYAIWGSVRGYVVKIVVYQSLCGDASPWEPRYDVMEQGILSALKNGWRA